MEYRLRKKIKAELAQQSRSLRAFKERKFMKAILANTGARLEYDALWPGGPRRVRLFSKDGNLLDYIQVLE